MATTFDEIYDLALIVIDDYKLKTMAIKDPERFLFKMQGFLIRAIPRFIDNSMESLEYDLAQKTFIEDLSIKAKDILASYIGIMWWESESAVASIIQPALGNKAFRRTSEANNLDAKRRKISSLNERVEQDISSYQAKFKQNNWFVF